MTLDNTPGINHNLIFQNAFSLVRIMIFRVLTSKDPEAFRTYRLSALLESPESFGGSYDEESGQTVADMAQRIEKEGNCGSFILGAWDDDNGLAGVVGIRRLTQTKMQHKAHLWGMYIGPGHRRQGLGEALLKQAIERAKQLEGVELLLLTVVTTNEAGIHLYEKIGFRQFGIEPHALKIEGTYYDEMHMILTF